MFLIGFMLLSLIWRGLKLSEYRVSSWIWLLLTLTVCFFWGILSTLSCFTHEDGLNRLSFINRPLWLSLLLPAGIKNNIRFQFTSSRSRFHRCLMSIIPSELRLKFLHKDENTLFFRGFGWSLYFQLRKQRALLFFLLEFDLFWLRLYLLLLLDILFSYLVLSLRIYFFLKQKLFRLIFSSKYKAFIVDFDAKLINIVVGKSSMLFWIVQFQEWVFISF